MSTEFSLRDAATSAEGNILVYRCRKCFRIVSSMNKVVEHFANAHQIVVDDKGFTINLVNDEESVGPPSTPTPVSIPVVQTKFPASRGYWNEDNRSICSTEDESDDESWADDILDRECVEGMISNVASSVSDKPLRLFDLPVAPASVKTRALEKLQKKMERASKSKQAKRCHPRQTVHTSSTASPPQNKSQVKSKNNSSKYHATSSKSDSSGDTRRMRKRANRFPAPNHPGKQFACALCPTVFRWRRTLFYHERAVHNRNNLRVPPVRVTRRRKHLRRKTSAKGQERQAVTKSNNTTDAPKESHPSNTTNGTAPVGNAIISEQVHPASQSHHQGSPSPSPPQDSQGTTNLLPCLWCPKRFPHVVTLQDHFYSEHKGQLAET